MRFRSFVPWVLVASTSLGGLGIGPVLAQAIKEPGWPPPEGAACKPTKTDDDEAKTLFGLAAKAEDTSNYADAIKYYKDAYKRACNRHLLLKNLGRAYEKDAQYAAAVEAYKLYRTRGKPTGEELDQIDQKITNLSKKVSTDPTATAPTTTATATETAPTTTATATPTTTATTTSTAPSSGGGGGLPLAPLIVTGIGGVLLIGGSIVWLGANGTVSDKQKQFDANNCRSGPPNPRLCNTIKEDGEKASNNRTIGAVVTGIGVAAVVGGLVWFFTSKKSASEATARTWQITPGPGVAGIGFSASF